MCMLVSKKVILLLLALILVGSIAFGHDYIIGEKSPEGYLVVGNYLFEQGQPEQAKDVYEEGLAEGEHPHLTHNMAYYYYELKEYDKAEEFLLKTIKLDADYAKAHESIAKMYNELGRYEDAIPHLQKLAELDPKNPSYIYDLGINQALLLRDKGVGNIDEAIANLERAEAMSPGYAQASENIEVLKLIRDEE